jgi:hypothetical protein
MADDQEGRLRGGVAHAQLGLWPKIRARLYQRAANQCIHQGHWMPQYAGV